MLRKCETWEKQPFLSPIRARIVDHDYLKRIDREAAKRVDERFRVRELVVNDGYYGDLGFDSLPVVAVLYRGFLRLRGFWELMEDGIVLVVKARLADIGYESSGMVDLVERYGGIGFHYREVHPFGCSGSFPERRAASSLGGNLRDDAVIPLADDIGGCGVAD